MCKICTECTIPGIPSSSAACAHVIAGWKTIRTHLQLHHVMHVTKSPELGLVRLIICALSLARLRGWPLAPRSASPFRLAAAPGSSTRRHRSAPGSARLVRSCRRAGHLRSQHGPRRMRRILTARRIPVRGWCACAGAIVSACLCRVHCWKPGPAGRRFEAQWTFRKTLVQIVRAAFVRGNFSPPGVSSQARRLFTPTGFFCPCLFQADARIDSHIP